MYRILFLLPLIVSRISGTKDSAPPGCDFCLGELCLLRTRCPKNLEEIFSMGDIDIDYYSNIIYYIDHNQLKSTDMKTGVTQVIPSADKNQSLVSLAVDRSHGYLYYTYSSNPIYRYEPKLNITNQVFISYGKPSQWPVSIWVNYNIIYFKSFSPGLYYTLSGSPEVRKVIGLDDALVDNIAFDKNRRVYISTKNKVYRIEEGDILSKSVTEYLPTDYLIVADRDGVMYFIKERKIYMRDANSDQLKVVGAFVHYPYYVMFDDYNYLLVEDLKQACSHYKPTPTKCKIDVDVGYVPKITVVSTERKQKIRQDFSR